MGIIQITKDNGSRPLAGLYTGRFLSEGQSFTAEIALFYNTAHPTGELIVVFLEIGTRIFPVETSRPIGTGGHTEATADATMKVHGHNAIFFHLEGRLGRTGPHAWWIITMVTEDGKVSFQDIFGCVVGRLFREDIFKGGLPYPFNLTFTIANLGNIVGLIAGGDGVIKQSRLLGNLAHVYNHSQADPLRFDWGMDGGAMSSSSGMTISGSMPGGQGVRGGQFDEGWRPDASEHAGACDLEEFSSLLIH